MEKKLRDANCKQESKNLPLCFSNKISLIKFYYSEFYLLTQLCLGKINLQFKVSFSQSSSCLVNLLNFPVCLKEDENIIHSDTIDGVDNRSSS